ncbi:MAG: GGDEF domain-containing protein [Lachnospiraceae bacterium]|nr:GGDEF domain-containing protein [Lachnospiraceae bacterium]
MNRSKEKRINKLKKKRIWPSILGLIVILFIFVVVMTVALFASGMDIVQRKFTESSRKSLKVAELFEDYDSETGEKIEQTVLSHIDVLEEIDAISVIDADRNPVWSSSGEYPVIDETINIVFLTGITGEEINVILNEDTKQVFSVEAGEIIFNENILMKLFSVSNYDVTVPFEELKLWLVIPVNGFEVLVLNNVPIYHQDFLMMGICILLCILLISVFITYYLISIISMVFNVRKTKKIIYTDMVTGGDNWLLFTRKGASLLKKNGKGKQNYALVHLEMRKYRSFCTCFGVNKGQELIESFYAALRKEIQKNEVMSHQEDAKFGLLLVYTETEQLEARIQQLKNAMNAVLPGMKMYFGAGVYLVRHGEYDVEQLYNNAMIACEMLGEEAENKIAYFDVEMNKQKLWERKVEDDMDRALANREFQVYLQPKISTSEEVLGGAEALVRWIHPTEGFISPNRFIPIFEKNGFILKLDDYMLEEIAKVQAGWLAQGRKLVPISVNVSRAHFTREDLAEHICAIVDKYQVPHSAIELELTESAFFDDKKVLLNTVQKLRTAGFPVSMDDFGAGYSSLNSLKELQIDVLKIDADFFRGADVEERGLLIVSEVIDLAKKLNMKIVAEGIESREQVEFLIEQECDLIQGYFYSKPMPVEEFAQKYNM